MRTKKPTDFVAIPITLSEKKRKEKNRRKERERGGGRGRERKEKKQQPTKTDFRGCIPDFYILIDRKIQQLFNLCGIVQVKYKCVGQMACRQLFEFERNAWPQTPAQVVCTKWFAHVGPTLPACWQLDDTLSNAKLRANSVVIMHQTRNFQFN